MDIKKYKHADLESKRTVFFQIGLACALGLSLVAFEWNSTAPELSALPDVDEEFEEVELIEIVREIEPEVMAPEPRKLTIFELVPDDTEEWDDEIDFSSEMDEEADILALIEDEPEEVDERVFVVVEQMPEFPGGQAALMKFISSNIVYPPLCAEMGIQGKVYLSFIVNKKGEVTSINVVRSPNERLSQEAQRVISMMPNWEPGRQRGSTANVSYVIPVNFSLR